MNHYKDSQNTLHVLDSTEYEHLLPAGCVQITDDEVAENEQLWAEENGKGQATHTDAAGELRSAGLSAAGIAGDLDMATDMSAPDDMEGDITGESGAAPVIPPMA